MRKARPDTLTDIQYWAKRATPNLVQPAEPRWYRQVERFLPSGTDVSCLEVGAVPGRALLFFAVHHGYHCTGLDFAPGIDALRRSFEIHGVEGHFLEKDFFTWEPHERFDIVYSQGFVEHFTEPQGVVERHWRLVRPGGLLILTVPFMSPVQQALRKIVYRREAARELAGAHNRRTMSMGGFAPLVANLPGGQVLSVGPVGEMQIWLSVSSPRVRPAARPFLFLMKVLDRLTRPLRWSSRAFSPLLLAVVRKGGGESR